METKTQITANLPSNLTDANGVYISSGADYSVYLPYRAFFINSISEDVNYNFDNSDFTVYQKLWDVYHLQCVVNESQAKDLTKLRASKSLIINQIDYNQILTADTSNKEFTQITLNPINGTALLELNLVFRVQSFYVDHITPENENYQLILTNKSVRTGLYTAPDSEFTGLFGYSKSFYTVFYPIFDEETPQTDALSVNFIDFATRLTAKKLIKLLFFLNETDKNILKRYATLCNSSVFVDKTQPTVLIGDVVSGGSPNLLTGSGFNSLVVGMFVITPYQINGKNDFEIIEIQSDTTIKIDDNISIISPTGVKTYKYYQLTGITTPEVNQVAKNLYDIKLIGLYDSETVYNN